MLQASSADKNLVVDILTKAFWDNLSVNYVIDPKKDKASAIKALMAYSFDVCMAYGSVFLNKDRDAAALFFYPHKKRTTFQTIWWDVRLLLTCFGAKNAGKITGREKIIHQVKGKKDMLYLWFIGVLPSTQGKGKGSALLTEVLQIAQQEQLPVYLETSMTQNLPLYKRFGFTIYHEHEFSYRLYFLRKDV
jgi:ribosomal protein S18 acetylase RimI-like enzyme